VAGHARRAASGSVFVIGAVGVLVLRTNGHREAELELIPPSYPTS
jgi:hypothetical protein